MYPYKVATSPFIKGLRLTVKTLSTVINWLIGLGFILLIGLYFGDRFFANGLFFGRILRTLLEFGVLYGGLSDLSTIGVVILIGISLLIFYLRRCLKRNSRRMNLIMAC